MLSSWVKQRCKVTLVEVGPRDGLQNEQRTLTVEQRVKFVELLRDAGLRRIEVGSFVSARWVPQMQRTDAVCRELAKESKGMLDKVTFSALVPNEVGMQQALPFVPTPLRELSVFTTVSETFSRRNTNCSVDESLMRIEKMIEMAQEYADLRIRAYVSCVTHCPYEGRTDAGHVKALASRLLQLGADEVSLGETTGQGTAQHVRDLMRTLQSLPRDRLAVHFHDTYGQAVGNVLAALDFGIEIVDGSVNGLGGCPYSPGAAGNVATEEVVYLLRSLNFLQDDIDLQKLLKAGAYASACLGRQRSSKLAEALLAHKADKKVGS